MTTRQKDPTSQSPNRAIIIECFDSPDNQHLVVTGFLIPPRRQSFTPCGVRPLGMRTERISRSSFVFLYVRKPSTVDFGDVITLNPRLNTWFLARGSLLRYRLTTDEFPPPIINRLIFDRL